ncbi:MAG TPA: glycosyltransferase family 1 protein [Anaerolineae bacterium]|nr:glycosyltransferase family 1 protein [Anaerolineae bacterium]
MRIALYHNLPSGGAKRTLSEAARRLAGHHHLDVYTLSSANHEFADLRPFVDNHKVYEFAPRPLFNSPFGRLNQAVRLADLRRIDGVTRQIAADIEAEGYDVVYVHPCQVEKSPSLLRHVQTIPTVYYCQEPLRILYETMPPRPYDDDHSSRRALLNRVDPLPGMYRSRIKEIDQRNTRQAGMVLVNSRFMQDVVSRIYEVAARVSYHGINVERFQPLGLEKRPYLLSVGSLTPLKGFDFLVEAVAGIPADRRPLLVIASNFQNPPEKQFLQQLAAEKEVNLNLLGNVSDERLVELYNEAAVTVYAPVREPFGLVALESLACGTPVIAVREGGTQETIVPGETGLLTERNPAAFAQAIQVLMADPALAEEYGRNGRESILQNWTWDRAVATLEAHLAAAVNKKSASSALVSAPNPA